jgi:hypothetical protein
MFGATFACCLRKASNTLDFALHAKQKMSQSDTVASLKQSLSLGFWSGVANRAGLAINSSPTGE